MPELQLIAVLSLVVYRVTRFFLLDSLIEEPRNRLHAYLLDPARPRPARTQLVFDKLYELTDCPFCFSVWVALGTVYVVDRYISVPLPFFTWLAVCGAAMVWWRVVEHPTDEK